MKIQHIFFLLIIPFFLHAQPVAVIQSDITKGCGNTAIKFNGNFSTDYTSFEWDFGNGLKNSTNIRPLVFFDPGNYEVVLTVYNGSLSNSSSVNITIHKGPSGIINYTTNNVGCVGDEIGFNAITTKGDANIKQVNWIYGDGEKGTGLSGSHKYKFANPMTGYPLVLEITDSNNCDFKTYEHIRISEEPDITIEADNFWLCDTGVIHFNANVHSKSFLSNISWDFGNGVNSNAYSPIVQYSDTGAFKIVLQAEDVNGCPATFNSSIYVDKMTVQISSKDSICSGDSLELKLNANNAKNVAWYINDSLFSNKHTFKIPTSLSSDSIKSRVVISNDHCISSDSLTTYVVPFKAQFSMDTLNICKFPQPVNFSDSTIGNVKKYTWNFGDGTMSNLKNPVHNFNSITPISLTAESNYGCVSEAFGSLTLVRPKPVITTSIDEGCLPQTVFFNPDSSEFISNPRSFNPYQWSVENGSWNSFIKSPDNTYSYPIYDTVKLTIHDEVCGDETITKILKFGHKPVMSYFTEDTLCIDNANFFNNNSAPADSIDEFIWKLDSTEIKKKSFNYTYFKDTAYYNWKTSDYTYIHQFPVPGDSSEIEIISGFYGCYDTSMVTLPLSGPVADITEDFITSCENPLEHNFVVDLYDVKKLVFQYINISGGTNHADSIDYGTPTTQSDTITTNLSPGFYHLYIHALKNNPVCTSGKYYTRFDCSDFMCERQRIVIGISDTVKAVFATDKSDYCSGELIYADYSSSANAFYVEWYSGQSGSFKSLSPAYNPMNTRTLPLINQVNPSMYQLDSIYNGFNSPACVNNPSDFNIQTDKANLVICDRGIYDLKLVAYSYNGCSDEMVIPGIVDIYKPDAILTSTDDEICYPENSDFIFKNIIQDTAFTSVIIDFNNGNDTIISDLTDTISVKYEPGIYTPFVLMEDEMGCKTNNNYQLFNGATWEPAQVISSFPDLVLPPTPYACINTDVVFYPEKKYKNYHWDFGDGTIVNTSSEFYVHAYSVSDTFLINLIVTDSINCKDTVNNGIIILKEPFFDITLDTNYWGCPIKILSIEDVSGNEFIIERNWELTNNNPIEDMPVISTPSSLIIMPVILPGIYDVSLTMTSNYCGTYDSTYTEIFELDGPYMKMIEPDSSYCPREIVSFRIDSGKIVNDPVLLNWSFLNTDNNEITFDENIQPNLFFTDAGPYLARLNYYDTNGCALSDTGNFVIHKLQASIEKPEPICEIPSYLNLTSTSVGYDTLHWYGKDTVDMDPVYQDTLTDYGSYFITLVVKDSNYCIDALPIQIDVNQKPQGIFSPKDTLICLFDTIEVKGHQLKNYVYNWQPENNIIQNNVFNPTILVNKDQYVYLNVTDTLTQCNFKDSAFIRTQNIPEIDYSYYYLPYGTNQSFSNVNDPIVIPVGDSVQLNIKGNQNNLIYNWESADGLWLSCKNCFNPKTSIEKEASITVTISDSLKCYENENFQVFQFKILDASIEMPTAFSPNNDGINDVVMVNGPGIEYLVSFQVYDQMGNLVYESSDLQQGWNGVYNNAKLPIGVYGYTVKAKALNSDLMLEKTGNIKLIR